MHYYGSLHHNTLYCYITDKAEKNSQKDYTVSKYLALHSYAMNPKGQFTNSPYWNDNEAVPANGGSGM